MESLIGEEQSSFVPRRQIVDNIIIVQEATHYMCTNTNKKSYIDIKVYLKKASDRLKWSFIRETFQLAGFPSLLINVIMDCISIVLMQVLWNGRPTHQFFPMRGIRQGDPISPYIFVLCMERLTHIIKDAVNAKRWKTLKFGRNGTNLYRIFFCR